MFTATAPFPFTVRAQSRAACWGGERTDGPVRCVRVGVVVPVTDDVVEVLEEALPLVRLRPVRREVLQQVELDLRHAAAVGVGQAVEVAAEARELRWVLLRDVAGRELRVDEDRGVPRRDLQGQIPKL